MLVVLGLDEFIIVVYIVVEVVFLVVDISYVFDFVGGGYIKEVIVGVEVELGDSEMVEVLGSFY